MKEADTQKEPKVVPTPVCLPPLLIEALDAQAAQEGLLRGRSAIIRRACAEYLERHRSGQSALSVRTEQEAA